MKKNGFSIIEILITIAIFTAVFAGIVTMGRSGLDVSNSSNNRIEQSANARNVLAILSNHLSSSNMHNVTLRNCKPDECLGEQILFKVPVIDKTSIVNTIYTSNGKLKFGAAGKQNCLWRYRVNLNNQLVKILECDPTKQYCGDGICASTETLLSCAVDCGTCGDTFCTAEIGETLVSCPTDCAVCGDGICTSQVETNLTCPDDCVPTIPPEPNRLPE